MTDIGVPVLEIAGSVVEGIEQLGGNHHRADRLITGTQTLGAYQQIWCDPVLFARVQGSGASHPAHHFIEDQQHPVAIADLANAVQVTFRRRDRAEGGANHRFSHKTDHRVWPNIEQRLLQLGRRAQPIGLLVFALLLPAIGVARGDVLGVEQQWRKRFAARHVTAHRARAEVLP